MPSFTTRVELHDAGAEEYERLHEEMEACGFSRTITSTADGVTYHLPDAEYDIGGDLTKSQVLGRAREAASQVVRSFSVLVTQSNGRTWHGLRKAE